MPNNSILITGAAGFIGFHVAQRLLSDGREVVGVDSVNDYYNPKLKEARLELLKRNSKFTFVKLDLADRAASKSLFEHHRFPVRYSLQNPHAYVDANIEGFINALEGCRHNGPRHWLRSVDDRVVMQPFDVGAGDRASMGERICKQSAKFRNTSTRHRRIFARRPRGQPIGRAENKLCTERTQFRLSESYVPATSTKGQVAPVSAGLEFIGRHSSFGARDALVTINYHQAPKMAKVGAFEIKRCHQRCANHANP